MLTREVMGVFALFVLWLNTGLVALAALARARDLLARRRAMAPLDGAAPSGYGVIEGVLEPPSGGGAPASFAIEQVGRHAAGTARAILWHDRSHASAVAPGARLVANGSWSLRGASGADAEVWLEAAAVSAAAACEGPASFEAAWPAAKKARGTARTIEVPVAAGTHVWVVGEARTDGGEVTVGPSASAPLVVSTFDPRPWLLRRAIELVVFAPITLLLCGGCTALALHAPVFDGVVSKIGGLVCFVYFLLVLPAGTRMRDLTAFPHVRMLRGRWNDPSAAA